MEGIDSKIELDWIDKRLKKLQQALLQMEHDKVAIAEQMEQGVKEVESLRAKEIVILAEIEESKKEIKKEEKKDESDKSGQSTSSTESATGPTSA